MCMISTEIKTISSTNIFVAPNLDMTKQLIVYSNSIDNISSANAMVLPVPLPSTVKFHDLSSYKEIFKDCAKCFYTPNLDRSGSKSYSNSMITNNGSKTLEVFNVGSYKASLANNLDELNNVDASVFDLSSGLNNVLKSSYSESHWGFIICKLNRGAETYHPFAYSHEIHDKIHIPTKHYHKMGNHVATVPSFGSWGSMSGSWGDGSKIASIDSTPMFSSLMYGGASTKTTSKLNEKNNEEVSSQRGMDVADDWAHSVYLMNLNPYKTRADSMSKTNEIWDETTTPALNKIDFNIGRCKMFFKLKIHGMHPNVDLSIPV